ncbi:uncharacterized protein LOC131246940 [Magnolia sinica]|uniref:uncharacterized protein LOC131246940 n=1 Tax=Magnolia sinica TaxID=86752 RepID=UPI00265814AC|nr:uncharacterized protein LOC131246940 [Magnolia sinica]
MCGVPRLLHSSVEGKVNHWRNASTPGAAPNSVRILLLILILWELWCSRNGAVYDNSPLIIRRSVARVRWWANLVIGTDIMDTIGSTRGFSPFNSVVNQYHSASIQVKWRQPTPGWVKLNVDGSSLGNPGPSGGGGICRNDSSAFILGFTVAYGVGSNNMAELFAIYDGMMLCLEKGLDTIILESDSKLLIDSLIKQSKTPWK